MESGEKVNTVNLGLTPLQVRILSLLATPPSLINTLRDGGGEITQNNYTKSYHSDKYNIYYNINILITPIRPMANWGWVLYHLKTHIYIFILFPLLFYSPIPPSRLQPPCQLFTPTSQMGCGGDRGYSQGIGIGSKQYIYI